MRSSAVSRTDHRARRASRKRRARRAASPRRRTEGCAPARGLAGPVDLAVTRGRAERVHGRLGRRRDRDAAARQATGELTQPAGGAWVHQPGGGGGRCIRGRALDEVWSVAVSPDGRNVYGVSARVNMLGAMARDRVDRHGCSQLPGQVRLLHPRPRRAAGVPRGTRAHRRGRGDGEPGRPQRVRDVRGQLPRLGRDLPEDRRVRRLGLLAVAAAVLLPAARRVGAGREPRRSGQADRT